MKINLIEYFEEKAIQVPDKIAVIEGDRRISFDELRFKSKSLATIIIGQTNSVNSPIAVYLPKSIESVFSDLAITYSGNTYMNLDVKNPTERIQNIFKTVQPVCVVSSTKYLSNIEKIIPKNVQVVNIDNIVLEHIDDILIEAKLSTLIDTDPYCIINTSGSTGTPKGVILNHRSFFDFIEWAVETLHLTQSEIIGSLSPSVFDIYSFELCMLMSMGSTVVLIPGTLSAFPFKILEILKQEKTTYLFWVPTIMVNIANLDLLSSIELPDIRTIWFAGEVFPTKQFNYWHNKLTNVKFVNLYGPIEITLDCIYYVVDRKFKDDEPIPIGKPCRNTAILILNEDNKLCEVGEEGELCVRGTSLAMGYYNNSEKTSVAFVQNPLNDKYPEIIYRTGDIVMMQSDGNVMFKGRRDTLIKHLGYRIELGEVEHIIVNTLKLVKNGCVVYNKNEKEITLFYENGSEISPQDFRKAIGESLPKYMIPTRYILLEKIPMNTNGKIDRLMLNVRVSG